MPSFGLSLNPSASARRSKTNLPMLQARCHPADWPSNPETLETLSFSAEPRTMIPDNGPHLMTGRSSWQESLRLATGVRHSLPLACIAHQPKGSKDNANSGSCKHPTAGTQHSRQAPNTSAMQALGVLDPIRPRCAVAYHSSRLPQHPQHRTVCPPLTACRPNRPHDPSEDAPIQA